MIWANKQFCQRVGVVAAVVWLGGVAIASAILPKFYWYASNYYDSGIGPAAITGVLGLAVIYALAVGIPWIAEAAKQK